VANLFYLHGTNGGGYQNIFMKIKERQQKAVEKESNVQNPTRPKIYSKMDKHNRNTS